jgi:predicted metal-dependent peptidase
LWSDTEVASEQFFDDGEAPVFIPRGGGGTDMRVPLAHATQFEPEVVILITDGYTPWPAREPDYPLIVVCTTNAPVPVGKVIRTKGA